jgi:O-antigen/teichoic acid export membrane protein
LYVYGIRSSVLINSRNFPAGGTFTGTYNGLGKMVLTLAGSTLQIALRVILTWFFFPHFWLAALAIATGIGWLMANLFWLICLTRLRRQSLLQA